METRISHRKLPLASIPAWISHGWRTFRRTQGTSMAYAGIFAAIGALLMGGAVLLDLAPMLYPLAGGFMLVGPVALAGFFHVADRLRREETVGLADFFGGFRRSPPALWVIALVCAFLFLVWITDAAIVYSLYFGTVPVLSSLEFFAGLGEGGRLLSFALFCSLTGAVLAFMIFAISAFAVPLIFERRLGLAQAVSASVKAVFGNFALMLAWGCVLAVSVGGSILLLLPLFVLAFPVLAYASEQAYRDMIA